MRDALPPGDDTVVRLLAPRPVARHRTPGTEVELVSTGLRLLVTEAQSLALQPLLGRCAYRFFFFFGVTPPRSGLGGAR